ncbi:MAG: aminoglycoside phosphotransferase family protein [Nostocaceae cyanobacterium]|nr:aminoglycoside phosphotransferase family protein [Nostocaceae cyanobacterium]
MNNLFDIANQFKPQGTIADIQEFGHGNINNTFLVTLDSSTDKHFILQRINTQVFRQPELVMRNISTFTHHVQQRLQHFPLNRPWEVPRVLLTQDNKDYWIDTHGSFWRSLSFIENTESFDTIQNNHHASEVGYALGMFHNLISDLPPQKLADTLPGFHITPGYLQHYQNVKKQYIPSVQTPELKYCLQFVSDRTTWAHVLENAQAQGHLKLRPIHGDPKVNNVMIDTQTEQAISIIDLDTVKPGLVHYDIGDCLRSACNSLGEETQEWEMVSFDTDICDCVLQGYLSVARDFLTERDYAYMYDAIRLIAFELGLRFFTDYLQGNIYFKTQYPEHNLARALVQFKLTESIESQSAAICKIIQEMR